MKRRGLRWVNRGRGEAERRVISHEMRIQPGVIPGWILCD